MLVVLVLLAGNAPNWVVPLVVLLAGLTYPLSFGGFTSLIPAIVPDELLTPANALETTSFNTRAGRRPGAGGHAVGRVRPGDARCSWRPRWRCSRWC